MAYTKQGPFSTGGTATAANLTAMDNGIAANDTSLQVLVLKAYVHDTTGGSVTVKAVQIFIGTTDPTTIGGVTVNDGDIWLKA